MSSPSKPFDKLQISIFPELIISSKSIVDFGCSRIFRADAENELANLDKEIANQPNLQAEFDQVLQYAKYILEHLPELLLDLCNPLRKAAFFAAIFNKIPTYDEIKFGTHKNSPLPEVNELFRIRMDDKT